MSLCKINEPCEHAAVAKYRQTRKDAVCVRCGSHIPPESSRLVWVGEKGCPPPRKRHTCNWCANWFQDSEMPIYENAATTDQALADSACDAPLGEVAEFFRKHHVELLREFTRRFPKTAWVLIRRRIFGDSGQGGVA
jgi:hypothetical protein